MVDTHLPDASAPVRAFAERQMELWWLRHGTDDRVAVAARLGLDYDPALDPLPTLPSAANEITELLLGISTLDAQLGKEPTPN